MQGKERVLWIDIAKAVAIIAMIVGHITEYGGSFRNLIYSFHMPLFFILTGYTMRNISNWKEWAISVKKDFLRLIIPAVIVLIINNSYSVLFLGDDFGKAAYHTGMQLLWASSFSFDGIPEIGLLWFLIVMFWAKLIYNGIKLIFPGKYYYAVYFILGIVGYNMSYLRLQIMLPQAFDITLIVVVLLFIGQMFKKVYDKFEKYQLPITFVAFLMWLGCLENGVVVDLGGRLFTQCALGLICSISGCIVIISLSCAIEGNSIITKIMTFIGRHTLLIMLCSYLIWILLANIPDFGIYAMYIIEPVITIGVASLIILAKTGVKSMIGSISNSKKR